MSACMREQGPDAEKAMQTVLAQGEKLSPEALETASKSG